MTFPRWAAPVAGGRSIEWLRQRRNGQRGGTGQDHDRNLPPSYQFVPAIIQVDAGATVTWTNNDNFTHSVLVLGSNDVHNMKPGEKAAITFDKAGEYDYVCTFHTQNMKGKVIVS